MKYKTFQQLDEYDIIFWDVQHDCNNDYLECCHLILGPLSWWIIWPFTPQGSWGMEGDMMKGTFTRKDNGKVLTTTRAIVGEELVQVSYPLRKMLFACEKSVYAPCFTHPKWKHIYTSEEENRQQTLAKVQIKCLKVPSLIYLGVCNVGTIPLV